MKNKIDNTKRIEESRIALDIMVAIMRFTDDGVELESKLLVAQDGRTMARGKSKIVNVEGTRVLFAEIGEGITWVGEDTHGTVLHAHAIIPPLPTTPAIWNGSGLLTQVTEAVSRTDWGVSTTQLRVDIDVPINACYKLGNVLVGIDPTENGMELDEAAAIMESVSVCLSFMKGGTMLEPV